MVPTTLYDKHCFQDQVETKASPLKDLPASGEKLKRGGEGRSEMVASELAA